jgi:hypothetical protein
MKKPWYSVKKPSQKTIEKWSVDKLVFWLTLHSREWEFLWNENIVHTEENVRFLRELVAIIARG